MNNLKTFSKFSIGTAQIGLNYGISNKHGMIKTKELEKIFQFLAKNNLKKIDTARAYGNCESIIGNQVTNFKHINWDITTKFDQKKNLVSAFSDSSQKLRKRPNIILAHSINLYTTKKFLKNILELKERCKIKKFGFSAYSEEDIIKGIKFYIPDVIQLPINILDHSLYTNGTLRKLKDLNIEIQARSIFLQGLFYLSDKVIQKKFNHVAGVIDKLKAISNCHHLTLPELSLKWVNSLEEIDSLIIGIESVDQINSHIQTIEKDSNNNIFDEALKINYSNIKITNPSMWK
tara:strand:- start:423 stop:1292 length:870 start_codon:yes stop_codon:yes gene_type:complete